MWTENLIIITHVVASNSPTRSCWAVNVRSRCSLDVGLPVPVRRLWHWAVSCSTICIVLDDYCSVWTGPSWRNYIIDGLSLDLLQQLAASTNSFTLLPKWLQCRCQLSCDNKAYSIIIANIDAARVQFIFMVDCYIAK